MITININIPHFLNNKKNNILTVLYVLHKWNIWSSEFSFKSSKGGVHLIVIYNENN